VNCTSDLNVRAFCILVVSCSGIPYKFSDPPTAPVVFPSRVGRVSHVKSRVSLRFDLFYFSSFSPSLITNLTASGSNQSRSGHELGGSLSQFEKSRSESRRGKGSDKTWGSWMRCQGGSVAAAG
jgi:hypothetical protein